MDKTLPTDKTVSVGFIEEVEAAYAKDYGQPPFNLSFWDPVPEFIQLLPPYLQMPREEEICCYRFSYDFPDLKRALLEKWHIDPAEKDCVLAGNGTQALSLAAHLIQYLKAKKVLMINPSYFAIRGALKALHIECEDCFYQEVNPTLIRDRIVWITNPLYSSGEYPDDALVGKLLEHNIVFCDECDAFHGHELAFRWGNHPHFIGLYAPHKSICVNGQKFSCLVYPRLYESFFEKCIDYTCGAIDVASLSAVKHFLGANYTLYQQKFDEAIAQNYSAVRAILQENNLPFPPYSHSFLLPVMFPHIPADLGFNRDFVRKTIYATGTSFIPCCLNRYSDENGFGFRINLSRYSSFCDISLRRMIFYFRELDK